MGELISREELTKMRVLLTLNLAQLRLVSEWLDEYEDTVYVSRLLREAGDMINAAHSVLDGKVLDLYE